MANWNEIPVELAAEIAKRLEQYEDFQSFGQVCSSWRISRSHVVNRPTNQQLPLLMIAEPHPGRFYSMYRRMVLPIQLPSLTFDDDDDGKDMRSLFDFKDGYYGDDGEYDYDWRYFSSCGWLILFREGLSHVVLLNPFTKRVIETPEFPSSYRLELLNSVSDHPFRIFHIVFRVILSHSPDDNDCFTLVLTMGWYTAVWNSKDDHWVFMDMRPVSHVFEDLVFYKGELYGIQGNGKIMHFSTLKVIVDLKFNFYHGGSIHMVESGGRLLVVYRSVEQDFLRISDEKLYGVYKTLSFKVWEVNVDTGYYRALKTIGDHALFVGFNSSFSVDVLSTNCGCRPNCIYYTDVYTTNDRVGKDMGIYDLVSGKILDEEIYYHQGLNLIQPALWVEAPK